MFNYIKFDLFLMSSLEKNTGWGDDVKVKAETSNENADKVQKLREELKTLDDIIKRVVWRRIDILEKKLYAQWNPKDAEYEQVLSTIKRLKAEIPTLTKDADWVRNELNQLLWNAEKEIRKISPDEMKKLKTIDNSKFLEIPMEKRLQYITKNWVDSSEISNWSVKDVEFTFTFDGQFNRELYEYTTAWQVLPKDVREVSSWWEKFERIWVNWEFYNKDKRLTIHEWTQVNIDKLWDKEELSKLEKQAEEKYNKFIEANPKYKEEQYTDAIKEMYNKWLWDEDVLLVLNFSYKELEKLDKEKAEKLLVVTRHLDNSWFLDDFMDAWEIITKLEEILAVLRQYGQNLKYKMNDKWEVKFDLNEKWLPEWLDSMPGLEKFRQIALSQLWTTEHNWWANKYFSETWFWNIDARNTPWCAAFVNRCLKMSWFEWTHSMAAKSFIKWEWFGHVWIKLWDKILWWNQWNKVSLGRINKPIVWYAIPTENWLEIHKPVWNPNEIPDWAIIVFDRTKKDKNMA